MWTKINFLSKLDIFLKNKQLWRVWRIFFIFDHKFTFSILDQKCFAVLLFIFSNISFFEPNFHENFNALPTFYVWATFLSKFWPWKQFLYTEYPWHVALCTEKYCKIFKRSFYICTINLRICVFFGQKTYIHFVAQKPRYQKIIHF